MSKTALMIASRMPLPSYATEALRYGKHPQERTLAFHQFYDAPIRQRLPDRTFSHMSDERVAFRAAFIISEACEMLLKGLGIRTYITFEAGPFVSRPVDSNDDPMLSAALQNAVEAAGKRDVVEVIDALGDLNVVVNGFAIELGVDMRRVDQEICASNFTKAGADGKPIIGDGTTGPVGKVLKGPNYVEPQLALSLGLEE